MDQAPLQVPLLGVPYFIYNSTSNSIAHAAVKALLRGENPRSVADFIWAAEDRNMLHSRSPASRFWTLARSR